MRDGTLETLALAGAVTGLSCRRSAPERTHYAQPTRHLLAFHDAVGRVHVVVTVEPRAPGTFVAYVDDTGLPARTGPWDIPFGRGHDVVDAASLDVLIADVSRSVGMASAPCAEGRQAGPAEASRGDAGGLLARLRLSRDARRERGGLTWHENRHGTGIAG